MKIDKIWWYVHVLEQLAFGSSFDCLNTYLAENNTSTLPLLTHTPECAWIWCSYRLTFKQNRSAAVNQWHNKAMCGMTHNPADIKLPKIHILRHIVDSTHRVLHRNHADHHCHAQHLFDTRSAWCREEGLQRIGCQDRRLTIASCAYCIVNRLLPKLHRVHCSIRLKTALFGIHHFLRLPAAVMIARSTIGLYGSTLFISTPQDAVINAL